MSQGVLLINKPYGWTSFDVVNKIRRTAQTAGLNTTHRKRFPVGHTGTLDPLATGLLVILLGKQTKMAPEFSKLDKVYQVTLKLGETSSTGDDEGVKTAVSDRRPSFEEVEKVMQRFVGDSMQVPPAFSAIKVNGQRAYALARKGRAVELQARPIHVASIVLDTYAYPYANFTAHVSSGTYIRSLVEDIGRELATGAYMSALCRTAVGSFRLADAQSMEQVTEEFLSKLLN